MFFSLSSQAHNTNPEFFHANSFIGADRLKLIFYSLFSKQSLRRIPARSGARYGPVPETGSVVRKMKFCSGTEPVPAFAKRVRKRNRFAGRKVAAIFGRRETFIRQRGIVCQVKNKYL